MKLPSRAARTLILALAVVAGTTIFARRLSSAEQADQDTAKLVAQMVPKYHLSRSPVDDAISSKLVDGFIEELDPQKLYFLQSDIDLFSRYRGTLDDALKEGNVDFAYQMFERHKQRATAQIELAHRLIDADHDFTIDEEMIEKAKDRPWAKTQDELNDRWRQWIKRELLEFKLDGKDLSEARQDLHKRYRNIQLININQKGHTEVLEEYLTRLVMCFDPHSSYMSPNTWEDFEIQFKLSLDGIGAALRGDDGYTVVAEIVPGGAADKDGRLKIGDKITGVGQEIGDIEDIFEMKLSEVVRKIRGKAGTKVRLQVKPAAGGETQVYTLVRQKIELNEQAVKGEIIDAQDRLGKKGRIGVIHVPSFYRDFEGANGNVQNFRSAAADVAKVLVDFNRQGVDAVVLDLRFNGGGALTEAIEMSGHFIDQGPVVQVKDVRGQIQPQTDDVPGVLWSGPLVVLCNRASASASEILAGVIKDYRRGLVVGDTTTHGKGTVQNLMDVAPSQLFRVFDNAQRGKLKLTISQFYRVNGDSTQNRGVRSDVVLPNIWDHADLGESFLDNALPFDQIQAASYSAGRSISGDMVAQLQKSSEQRVAADGEFQKLQQSIQRLLDRKNRKTVTLQEEKARAERDADQEAKEENPLNPDDEKPKAKDGPIFPKNFYNDEVLNVTLDYVGAVQRQLAVQRR
jgi:carboxyl-terminal processing protease